MTRKRAVLWGIGGVVLFQAGFWSWVCHEQDWRRAAAEATAAAPPAADARTAQTPLAHSAPVTATPPFAPAYTVVEDKLMGFNRGPRFCARITVPPGLAREALKANIEHALLAVYAAHAKPGALPSAVCVFVFKPTDDLLGAHTAGKGDYAPGGKWPDADAGVPLERWQTTVELSDEYFVPAKPLRFAPGEHVVLGAVAPSGTPLPNGTVNIMAAYPDREPVLAIVQNGTEADVLEGRSYHVSPSMTVDYYRVQVVVHGEHVEGWVPDSRCHWIRGAREATPRRRD
ncbi:MAG: hypothetical protein ACOYOB_19570 [Myxococcota bacterium]